MTDTTEQEFNFDAFMYGVRRDSPFDGSTLADSISNYEVRRAESAFNSLLKRAEKAEAEIAALKAKLANPVALEYRKQDGFTDPEKLRLINAVTDRCAAAIKESGFAVKEGQ